MEISYFLNASKDESVFLQPLSFGDFDSNIGTSYAKSWNNSGRATERENNELYSVPAHLIILLSFAYGLIAAVAVIGNVVVLVAIGHSRNMHTVTNFFIANLSAADALIGLFSIPFQFQAALLQRWDLPKLLCKVAPFVKEVSVSVSVLALVVVSIDRYIAVLHPLRRRLSRRAAATVMFGVWLTGIASGLPSAVIFRVFSVPVVYGADDGPRKPFCMASFPRVGSIDTGATYRLLLAALQYFIPLVVICFTYIRIMKHVWLSTFFQPIYEEQLVSLSKSIHQLCSRHQVLSVRCTYVWLSRVPGSAVDTRDHIINRNKRKVNTFVSLIIFGNFLFAY